MPVAKVQAAALASRTDLKSQQLHAHIGPAKGTLVADFAPGEVVQNRRNDELIKRTAKYAQKTIVGQAEKAWKKAEKLRQERDLTSFRNFVNAISDFEKFIKSLGESILD